MNGRSVGDGLARMVSAVLVFGALVAVVMIAAPLSLEAPFLGILITGSDSAWTVVGSFAAALVLVAICSRGIVRAAIRMRPGRQASFRLGVLALPVVALGLLLVPEAVNEHVAPMATVSLPAVFAVAMGAATGWIGRRTAPNQRSASSVPSPLSNEPVR